MSTTWQFHCEYIRATGVGIVLALANFDQDRVWSGTDPLHLGSIPTILGFRPADRLVRLAFFSLSVWIIGRCLTALTFAHNLARFAPSLRTLPTEASFAQNGANGVFTHL